jgi:four helix bundle protein
MKNSFEKNVKGEIRMAGFKKFEDILAWQKARQSTRLVYEITAEGQFAKDFGLRDQIRRSCVSVMANIAEGYGRRSDKEFSNFLNIAHGSIAETQSHLYIALDLNYLNRINFNRLYALLDEVSRMVMSLTQHLRKTP